MNIVLVARDVGPSHSLRIIGDRLTGLGHHVESFLGNGKPLPEGALEKITAALATADRLLVAVSSLKSGVLEELHAFKEAKRLGVSVAIFSETYGTYQRSSFRDLMMETNILFIIDEQETEIAKKYVGPSTRVIASGNPYWAEFFKTTVSREEVRTKIGVSSDEKMVMAVGNKERDRNELLYSDLVRATSELHEKVRLVLTLHPGADHPTSVYDDILKSSPYPVQFVGREDGLTSQEIVAGSNLVVTAGGSSVGIMAACQRVPVLDVIHPLDKQYWQELSGLDFWPPAKLGASMVVENSADLRDAMKALLDHDSSAAQKMWRAQKENFSLAMFENAVEKIATVIIT